MDPDRKQEIIDFATTDAYNEYEQLNGWGIAFTEFAHPPFPATALGREVQVLDFDGDPHKGIRCEIQAEGLPRRWVGLDTLDPGSLPTAAREVLEAFEDWSGGDY